MREKTRSSITEWFIYISENVLLILQTDNERVLFYLYITILEKQTRPHFQLTNE